jgi:glycine oxidase
VAPTERIAIVGAGIIGCAVAFELSRRGADVAVYDGRPLAGGATQASAGILAPYTEAHGRDPLFDLMVRGLRAYDGFVERVREASPVPFEYRRLGTLEIAEDDTRASELRSRLSEAWAEHARLQWLDEDALRRAAPSITGRAIGALKSPAHGYVAVPAFTAAIADAARNSGARIYLETRVDRIELVSAGVVLHVGARGVVFERVVLCAGAWTPGIDPLDQTSERIRPVRGQLVRLFAPDVPITTVLWGKDCYIVPWEDGTLLVGATSEEVGFDERSTAQGVRMLLAAAEGLVPELGAAAFVDVRVGLRPASAAGVPVLGPGRDPRVVYAAGHFRNGILLAPLTAQLIGDYVSAGTLDPAFSTS